MGKSLVSCFFETQCINVHQAKQNLIHSFISPQSGSKKTELKQTNNMSARSLLTSMDSLVAFSFVKAST